MTYAANTSVSVEKSKVEVDRLLSKAGAGQRGIVSDDNEGKAAILFSLEKRQYRLEVPLPKRDAFKKDRKGYTISSEHQQRAWEQACRSRWRSVVLLVKAKLEIVALGLSTVEREFLADLVLPNGSTVHRELADRITEAYQTGGMPPLLGAGS